jgi:hypothetical protein
VTRKSVKSELCLAFFHSRKLLIDVKTFSLCASCLEKAHDINIPQVEVPENFPARICLEILSFARTEKKELEKEVEKPSEFKGLALHMISNETCVNLTRLKIENVHDLARQIGRPPQLVFEFLVICKMNLSHREAGELFLKDHSTISRTMCLTA